MLYDALKAVHGPHWSSSTPVKSADGTLLTKKSNALERWAEHFDNLLNREWEISNKAIDQQSQLTIQEALAAEPDIEGTNTAIKNPSELAWLLALILLIASDIYQHDGEPFTLRLVELFLLRPSPVVQRCPYCPPIFEEGKPLRRW